MDYQKAQNFWVKKDQNSVHMKEEDLKKEIASFAQSHNTMALATGYDSYVRCTPVEYTYYKDAYWVMSEGGKKFIGLEKNRQVSFAIFDPYEGFGKINGLQINGTAELIEPFSDTYKEFLAYKKIPEQAIRQMEEPMPMIRITPSEADLLESSLKEKGFSNHQHLSY
jgi:general stress protein 26